MRLASYKHHRTNTSFVKPKPAIGATEVQCRTAGRSEMSEPDLAIRMLEELILMRNQSSALLKEVQQLARQHAVHSRSAEFTTASQYWRKRCLAPSPPCAEKHQPPCPILHSWTPLIAYPATQTTVACAGAAARLHPLLTTQHSMPRSGGRAVGGPSTQQALGPGSWLHCCHKHGRQGQSDCLYASAEPWLRQLDQQPEWGPQHRRKDQVGRGKHLSPQPRAFIAVEHQVWTTTK
ncbi:hypothetical protein HaLaN_03574, partial [Haematococcus lacustris]